MIRLITLNPEQETLLSELCTELTYPDQVEVVHIPVDKPDIPQEAPVPILTGDKPRSLSLPEKQTLTTVRCLELCMAARHANPFDQYFLTGLRVQAETPAHSDSETATLHIRDIVGLLDASKSHSSKFLVQEARLINFMYLIDKAKEPELIKLTKAHLAEAIVHLFNQANIKPNLTALSKLTGRN